MSADNDEQSNNKDDLEDLIAHDPALRRLIAESSWQSVIAVDKNEDRVLDSLLSNHRGRAASSDNNNNNNTNNNDDDVDEDVNEKIADDNGLLQRRRRRNRPDPIAATSASAEEDGALGIRRDATTGRVLMHVDPGGIFFGGAAAAGETAASGGGGGGLLMDSGGADGDEAFDYEMTADDVAFYEELREMKAARERLLAFVESQKKETHPAVAAEKDEKKEKRQTEEQVEDKDEKSDTQQQEEEDDDDADDPDRDDFLQSMKARTADLYAKFVETKRELKETRRNEQQQQNQLQQKQRRRGGGNRSSSAAAAAAAHDHATVDDQQSMLADKKHRPTAAVAQLLRDIQEEQQQQQTSPPPPAVVLISRRAPALIVAEAEAEILQIAAQAFSSETGAAAAAAATKSIDVGKLLIVVDNCNHNSGTNLVLSLMQELKVVSDECLESAIALVESEFDNDTVGVGPPRKPWQKHNNEEDVNANNLDDDDDDDDGGNAYDGSSAETSSTASPSSIPSPSSSPTRQKDLAAMAEDIRLLHQFYAESDNAELRLFSDARRELARRQLEHAVIAEDAEHSLLVSRDMAENVGAAAVLEKHTADKQLIKESSTRGKVIDHVLLPESEIVGPASASSTGRIDLVVLESDNVADFPSALSSSSSQQKHQQRQSGSAEGSSDGKKNHHHSYLQSKQHNDLRDQVERQRLLGQRRLMRQRLEAHEATLMAIIDQHQQRRMWVAERCAVEYSTAEAALLKEENAGRLSVRSEESTRSHDLRVRETRQRAILMEWQAHQREQEQSEQRSSIARKSEPEVRQRLQDVESVAWAEIAASFAEQRALLLAEEENRRVRREREERDAAEKKRNQLEADWLDLQRVAAQQAKSLAVPVEKEEEGTDGHRDSCAADANTTKSLHLLELLRTAVTNLAGCRAHMLRAARISSNVADVARAAATTKTTTATRRTDKKIATTTTTGGDDSLPSDVASFLSFIQSPSASSSHLSRAAIVSDSLLLLLPEKTTAEAASVAEVVSSAGFENFSADSFISQLASSSSDPALRFFCDQTNFIKLTASSSSSSPMVVPNIDELERVCSALIAVDFHGQRHGLKFVSSSGEDQQQQQQIKKPRGKVKLLDVSECALSSLDGIYHRQCPHDKEEPSAASLNVLFASRNSLSGSFADHSRFFSMLSSLIVLDLSHNQLDSLEIATSSSSSSCSDCFMPSLQKLDVSHNRLAGPAPEWLLQHAVTLRELDVSGNAKFSLRAGKQSSASSPIVWPLLEVLDLRGTESELDFITSALELLHKPEGIVFAPCLRLVNGAPFPLLPLQQQQHSASIAQLLSSASKAQRHFFLTYLPDLASRQSPSLSLSSANNGDAESSSSSGDKMLLLLRALSCHRSFVEQLVVDTHLVNLFAPGALQLRRRPSSASSSSVSAAAALHSASSIDSQSQQYPFCFFNSTSGNSHQNHNVIIGPLHDVCRRRRAAMEINRAAMVITRWWRRHSAFSVLAERAQRRIAPVWRGAWTRMRLKKMSEKDDDLAIPEMDGDLLDGIVNNNNSGKGALNAASTLIEALRRGPRPHPPAAAQASSASAAFARSSGGCTPTVMQTSSSPLSSPSSTSAPLFIIRNDDTSAGSASLRHWSAKNTRSSNPFPPPAASLFASSPAPVVARSASATIVGGAGASRAAAVSGGKKKSSHNEGDDDAGGGGGVNNADDDDNDWTSGMKDLLKFRDRKRKSQKAAQERAEWLKNGTMPRKPPAPPR